MGERSGLARAGKEVCVQGVRAVLVREAAGTEQPGEVVGMGIQNLHKY